MGKEIDKYKIIEKLGWTAFSKTGDINCYGMVVSARELAKEKLAEAQAKESEENGFGMY